MVRTFYINVEKEGTVTNGDVINSIFGKYFSIPLATTEEWLDAPYEEVNADGDSD